MNTENTEELKTRLETDLLAIIKEGRNLKRGEYIVLNPGVRVKAEREREFKRLCDNYYELEFNQIIENNTDTITPVYEKLVKLVETENEEYYISKASSFVLEVKDEVDRYKNLVKSFSTVDNAYKLTVKNLNDLYLKRENTPEWQKRVEELNNEVQRLTQNSAILTEQILAARKNVNEALIKYAEEQMEAIRQSFLHTSKDAMREAAMDHNFVLASDKVEYDSLYRLVLILKHANEVKEFDKLVCVDDAMFVTEDQKEVLNSTILSNIKLYGYIKAPEKKEVAPRDINKEFIAVIQKKMGILEERGKTNEKVAWESTEEYDRLINILNILHKANDSKYALVPVWDQVYVLAEDKDKMLKLLNESKVLYKRNPDYEKRQENEKIIQDLYDYLDKLANKVTNYKGVANLPIKSTNAVGDRAWVVIDSDFQEANRIVEMIKLLQNQKDNLTKVWGIANVNSNDMPRFKRLANSIKFFDSKVPTIPENEVEIKKVHEQVKELIKKAKNTENAVLAANGLVLESDLPLYKLLEEKFQCLDAAKSSDNLELVDGALIESEYAPRYHEVNKKINELISNLNASKSVNSSEIVEDKKENVKDVKDEVVASENNNITNNDEVIKVDLSANEREIERLKARLAELNAKSSQNENERKEFDLLYEQIELLEKVKADVENYEARISALSERTDLSEEEKNILKELKEGRKYRYAAYEELNGLKFMSGDRDEYIKSLANMDELKGLNSGEETRDSNISKNEEKSKASISEKLGIRKKIKGIRKLGIKAYFFVKENWRQIIAIGLASAAIIYFLPQLVPTLIFANSCNAAAIPALSGVLNSISAAIAPLAGISFVPGMGAINLGVNASLAGPALIEALSKIGVLSVGGFSIGYAMKQIANKNNEVRLPIPNEEDFFQIARENEENKNLEDKTIKSNLTATDIINAQIEYESNQENLTGEGLTEEEILEKIDDETLSDSAPKAEEPVISTDSTPKEDISDEVKRKQGEEIQERLRKDREALEKAREAREESHVEHDTTDEETLKNIQERVAEFTSQTSPEDLAAATQDMAEAEAAKQARENVAMPVIEVPSTESVISQLGSETTVEEPELLEAEPTIKVPETGTSRLRNLINKSTSSGKTAQVIGSIIGESPYSEKTEAKEQEKVDSLLPEGSVPAPAPSLEHNISQDEIENLLGDPIEVPVVTPAEEFVINEESIDLSLSPEEVARVAQLESEIKNLQKAFDNSGSDSMKLAFERAMEQKNAEIKEIKGKGRGR